MWEIIGHDDVVEMLQRAIHADRLPHSLLIIGPAGVGKTRLGLELAKVLNCTGESRPCQHCIHCRHIEQGSHPDVTLVERAEGKESIAIQQIRSLRDAASLRPFQGRRKVYLIEDAEGLTDQAADALLKTLEEPQPQVTLVLTASDSDALPETVVSRCRTIQLRAVAAADLARALQERGSEPKQAERIARLARGSVGWALRVAKQPALMREQEQVLAQLRSLPDLGLEARLQLAESLVADRKSRSSVRRNVELLALLARDLLLLTYDLPPLLTEASDRELTREQAQRLGPEGALCYLKRLRLTMDRIDQNVDPRLALEALMTGMP